MDKKVEMPPINERIYSLVQEKTGGNISKFANHIGSSPQKIQRLFSPDPRNSKFPEPSLEVVDAISKGYDISIDYIVNGVEIPNLPGVERVEKRQYFTPTIIDKNIDDEFSILDELKRKDELNIEFMKENKELRKRIDQLTDELLAAYKNK